MFEKLNINGICFEGDNYSFPYINAWNCLGLQYLRVFEGPA